VVESVHDVHLAIASGNVLELIMSISEYSFDLCAKAACRGRKVGFVDNEWHRQRKSIDVEDRFVDGSIGGGDSVDHETAIPPVTVQANGQHSQVIRLRHARYEPLRSGFGH